jgi:hypothetical protein
VGSKGTGEEEEEEYAKLRADTRDPHLRSLSGTPERNWCLSQFIADRIIEYIVPLRFKI